MDAGLWDRIEVLQFDGIISKIIFTQVSSAQGPSAHDIFKGEVTHYVMDNLDYFSGPLDSWHG